MNITTLNQLLELNFTRATNKDTYKGQAYTLISGARLFTAYIKDNNITGWNITNLISDKELEYAKKVNMF